MTSTERHTIESGPVTVTVERNPIPEAESTRYQWHYTVSGPRGLRGQGYACLTTYDGGKPAVVFEVGASAVEWNESRRTWETIYRDADPDAEPREYQTGHAVVIDPVTINHVPYEGSAYYVQQAENPHNPGPYVATRNVHRIGGRYGDTPSDAASKVLHVIGEALAGVIMSPIEQAQQKIRNAKHAEDTARHAVEEAQRTYAAARDAHAVARDALLTLRMEQETENQENAK